MDAESPPRVAGPPHRVGAPALPGPAFLDLAKQNLRSRVRVPGHTKTYEVPSGRVRPISLFHLRQSAMKAPADKGPPSGHAPMQRRWYAILANISLLLTVW